MTEAETLRALLAEARAVTQDSLDSNTTGFEAEDEVCKCSACERYRSIIARIDAALAEPESGCVECAQERAEYDSLAAQNRLLHRERDEARAEVYRLGMALTQETKLSLYTQRQLEEAQASTESLTAEFQRAIADCDEARAEVKRLKTQYEMLGTLAYADVEVAEAKAKTAYQRGAEAMREAAASKAYTTLSLHDEPWKAVVDAIEALPTPEEKP